MPNSQYINPVYTSNKELGEALAWNLEYRIRHSLECLKELVDAPPAGHDVEKILRRVALHFPDIEAGCEDIELLAEELKS